jgi:site-specific recombinase XerD
MPDLIAEFCAARFDYHQISASRRRQQPKVLRAFEASLDGRQLTDATAADLSAYLGSRVAAGRAPNTVRKELNMVKPFFTWLWQDRHLIDGETYMRIKAIRPPRGTTPFGRPRPYKRAEIDRLHQEVALAYPWLDAWRHKAGVDDVDRAVMFVQRWQRGASGWSRVQPFFQRVQIDAIIALALYGGLRCDEIYRLGLEAMHPDNDYVVVQGARKNASAERIERAVPWMTDEMRDRVDRWLAARTLIPGVEHDRPWLSLHQHHRHKPMSEDTFRMLLTNLGSGWEFHRLRHTAITAMMRAMPEKPHIVQRIAGHSRLSQTLQYAELLPGDLVAAARAAARDFRRQFPEAA